MAFCSNNIFVFQKLKCQGTDEHADTGSHKTPTEIVNVSRIAQTAAYKRRKKSAKIYTRSKVKKETKTKEAVAEKTESTEKNETDAKPVKSAVKAEKKDKAEKTA